MKNKPTDKEQISSIIEKSYETRMYDLPKSVRCTKKALKQSQEIKDVFLMAKSLSRLGLYAMIQGEYKKSLELSQKAIDHFEDLDDEENIADAKYTMGTVYYKSKNYQLGMAYLLDCLYIYRKFQSYANESRALKGLGTIYEYLGERSNAKTSFKKSIKAAKLAKDKNLEANTYNPLSGLLLKEDSPEKAFALVKKAIDIKLESGDRRGLAFSIYGRAKVYLHQERYEEALEDLLAALKLHEGLREFLGMAMVYLKLGILYKAMGNMGEAENTILKAAAFCEVHKLTVLNVKCQSFLYRFYKAQGCDTRALHHLEKQTQIRDSVAASEFKTVIENYETTARMIAQRSEERIQKEKMKFREKQEIAEQHAKMKLEFLSVMSHEIRTPLNAIANIVALLEERSENEEKSMLRSLRFSSKNLLHIIDDILDFSKLESKMMTLEKKPVRFIDFINSIGELYCTIAKEKNLLLKVVLDPKIGTSYIFDEKKLFQVLGNLLSNAIKYTAKGTVTLTVKVKSVNFKEHTVHFSIKDTGMGIKHEEKDKLFDSFYIPHSVTTRANGGTGLGLAIVRKLLELQDSKIYVESKVDKGSEFYFDLFLPLGETPVKVLVPDFKELKNKTVILAEDNNINAMIAIKMLERCRVSVVLAKNGAEAVARAKKNKVDFILMDIHMPVMNGFEAAKSIRETTNPNQNTPIFALTADITAIDQKEYNGYFNEFLLKPMDMEHLVEAFLSADK